MAYTETIPPGSYWSGVIPRGRTLRLTDVEGAGAASLLAYNADAPSERYNAPDTTKVQNMVFLTAGLLLLSDMGRVLFTIGGDAQLETLSGCTTARTVVDRYGPRGSYLELRNERFANARDNFIAALGRHGLDKRDIVPSVNLFARVEVDPEGGLRYVDRRRPGQAVDLHAEMNVLVAVSATPHVLDPGAAYAPGPLQIDVLECEADRAVSPEARRAYENTARYLDHAR